MLCNNFPELGTDLVAALTTLNADDFTHSSKKFCVSKKSFVKKYTCCFKKMCFRHDAREWQSLLSFCFFCLSKRKREEPNLIIIIFFFFDSLTSFYASQSTRLSLVLNSVFYNRILDTFVARKHTLRNLLFFFSFVPRNAFRKKIIISFLVFSPSVFLSAAANRRLRPRRHFDRDDRAQLSVSAANSTANVVTNSHPQFSASTKSESTERIRGPRFASAHFLRPEFCGSAKISARKSPAVFDECFCARRTRCKYQRLSDRDSNTHAATTACRTTSPRSLHPSICFTPATSETSPPFPRVPLHSCHQNKRGSAVPPRPRCAEKTPLQTTARHSEHRSPTRPLLSSNASRAAP